MKGHDNAPFVREYMEKHPGRLVPVSEVARQTGIHAGTVSGCMRRLSDAGIVEKIALGVYRLGSGTQPGENGTTPMGQLGYMVEIIGRTRDGHPLGEGEDGILWVLHERGTR